MPGKRSPAAAEEAAGLSAGFAAGILLPVRQARQDHAQPADRFGAVAGGGALVGAGVGLFDKPAGRKRGSGKKPGALENQNLRIWDHSLIFIKMQMVRILPAVLFRRSAFRCRHTGSPIS